MSLDFHLEEGGSVVFETNITHNLTRMANAAGIYQALWRPEERGYTQAKDVIPFLERGLLWLIANKREAETFNARNGWGLYEHFVPFVTEVLAACHEYPNATIHVSR